PFPPGPIALARPFLADMLLKNGLKVRSYHKMETDWLVKEIFEDHTYGSIESEDGEKIELEFKPGMTVVDVGGNIGMFALYAWDRCGRNARVHSFEPMPAIFDVLSENCKRVNEGSIAAGVEAGVSELVAHRVACSTEKGSIEFQFHPYMSLWSTLDADFDADRHEKMEKELALLGPQIAPGWLAVLRPLALFLGRQWLHGMQRTQTVTAPTARLSDELEAAGVGASSGGRIGLLKVDVEGAELQVLAGLSDADWKRVDQVAMEVESEKHRDTAVAILKKHGLKPVFAPAHKIKGADKSRVWNLMAVRK
ncbi:fkbM, partial [Symbiodinium sp. KB8]